MLACFFFLFSSKKACRREGAVYFLYKTTEHFGFGKILQINCIKLFELIVVLIQIIPREELWKNTISRKNIIDKRSRIDT